MNGDFKHKVNPNYLQAGQRCILVHGGFELNVYVATDRKMQGLVIFEVEGHPEIEAGWLRGGDVLTQAEVYIDGWYNYGDGTREAVKILISEEVE